jgi:peptidoglycan hydrolase-like protein with peptidoglycan-binding domain
MPSTLRAFATLAGCVAVTAATLVAGAAPVVASATPTSATVTLAHAGAVPAPTRADLTQSTHRVTYPGKVKLTATLTSAGHPVKGLTVKLQHRTHGTTIWHHVKDSATLVTSRRGMAHWWVRPTTGGTFRVFSHATKHFAAATSIPRGVGLRPSLHLSIPSSSDVLLPIKATGRVSPRLSGRVVLQQRLHHHWRSISHPRVRHGTFHAAIRPSVPGTDKFRVVRPKDVRHLSAASPVVATHVTAPTLRLGSSGPVVAALQRRLHNLHYDVGARDGSYGWDAEHAVTAFEKVQRMSPDGVAGPSVFKALADPKKPHLHHRISRGTAVEVNLDKEVLLISKHGKLWRILDTSTGGGYLFSGSNGQTERAVTPRGHFHVVYKVNALVHARLGTLNRPSFFNFNGYAIHGEGNGNDGGEVPPFPNSHGCVRITDNAVNRYYSLLAVGTSVWIY